MTSQDDRLSLDPPAAESAAAPEADPRRTEERPGGQPNGATLGSVPGRLRRRGIPRFVIIVLGVAGGLGALLALKQFSGIVGPFFLGLNLVIAAYPVQTWLVRHHWPRWLASVVVGLLLLLVLAGMLAGLVWSVASTVDQLTSYSAEFTAIWQVILGWLGGFGIDQSTLTNMFGQINPNSLLQPVQWLLSGVSTGAGLVVVIVLALAFLVMDVPSTAHRMERIARERPRVTGALDSFSRGVRNYWVVTTVFGLIVAILDGIALAVLQVPLPVVWALLSFLTNYIPNIGFVIGLIPPTLVALVANGWQTAVIVVIAYCALNFVVQSVIQPRFTGASVGVTATVSFLSLLVWGYVLGAVGTLIALPMTLLVKAFLVDPDPGARWVDALVASDPDKSDSSMLSI